MRVLGIKTLMLFPEGVHSPEGEGKNTNFGFNSNPIAGARAS